MKFWTDINLKHSWWNKLVDEYYQAFVLRVFGVKIIKVYRNTFWCKEMQFLEEFGSELRDTDAFAFSWTAKNAIQKKAEEHITANHQNIYEIVQGCLPVC